MIKPFVIAACLMLAAACSDSGTDQAAIDAAVEKALAEREREAAAQTSAAQTGNKGEDASLADANETAGRAPEALRDGLPTGMGSPYGMCIRTLSIVGEHCGCMVNRATDAGITGPALVGLFGGDGKRASPDQIDRFKRIVRGCAGYNITVRGSMAAPALAGGAPDQTPTPAQAASSERMARCEFQTTRSNYDGPCRFLAGKGGDFRAISTDGAFSELDGIYRVDLDVTGKDKGSLMINHGYEPFAIAVIRSQTDRACWTSAEVTFCAR